MFARDSDSRVENLTSIKKACTYFQTIKSVFAVLIIFSKAVIHGAAEGKTSRNCLFHFSYVSNRSTNKFLKNWCLLTCGIKIKLDLKEEIGCEEILTVTWEPWSTCNSMNLRSVSTDTNFLLFQILAKKILQCHWV